MSRIEHNESDSVEDQLRYHAFAWNAHQALRGGRGQRILRELEAALIALPERRLIRGEFVTAAGEVCALGALALRRKLATGRSVPVALAEIRQEFGSLDEQNADVDCVDVGRALGIGEHIAWETIMQNDERREGCMPERQEGCTPERRYEHVLTWVRAMLARPGGGMTSMRRRRDERGRHRREIRAPRRSPSR
mgnify:CR=1 FL=1